MIDAATISRSRMAEVFLVTKEMQEPYSWNGMDVVPKLASYNQFLQLSRLEDTSENFIKWSQICYTYMGTAGNA